jgi:hypothetical protein
MRGLALVALLLAPLAARGDPAVPPGPLTDDYPTAARADYVLGCMNVNGGTREALRACSCSIDVIATILPYKDYEAADTILSMRLLGGGYLASEFRTAGTNTILDRLHEAQAEAEVRCF